jgi:hypothetical protein
MSIKTRYWYLLIVLGQIGIVYLTFLYFFQHPANSVFCTYGDGIKNYFTLQSFVSDPISTGGILKYNYFAYPFGDYVYYTDNTALFSVPFRWYCQHIHDISAYAIPAFNFFIISNIIVCAVVAFWIFQRLWSADLISFLLAMTLPWIGPQVQRIWCGHYNLSLTSLPVIAIALFIIWYENRAYIGRQIWVSCVIVLFCITAFLVHGYYMAIITLFIVAMLFFYSAFTFKSVWGKHRMTMAILLPLLTIGVIIVLLQVTDVYLPLRKEAAMGYDWDEQKTILSQLFTHYSFHRVFFPLYSSKSGDSPELNAYLGNIGLFSFGFMFMGSLLSKTIRLRLRDIQKEFFADPLKKSIFFAGLLLLLISFGEKYNTNKAVFRFTFPFSLEHPFTVIKLIVYALTLSGTIFGVIFYFRSARHNVVTPTLKERILVTLIAAILIYLLVAQYTVAITNILNPFFYLHFFTKRVEQFRSIARFNWPFFWTFYIWVMYTIVRLYQTSGNKIKTLIVVLMLLLGGIEVADNSLYLTKRTKKENPFSVVNLQQFKPLKIDYRQYQAILPLPYYIAGSEDYTHTIDDNDDYSTYTMQFSLFSKLPLMACKMSRTPPTFSVQLLDFVANDQISPEFKSRLNHKPILIMLNKDLLKDTNASFIPSANQAIARALCLRTLKFVERHQLHPIDSIGVNFFYSFSLP